MKLVILEPLGVEKEKFLRLANEALSDKFEIVYYENRVEDTETLIERSKDADVVMLSNFKFDREVMSKCKNLKMVCVAFTGVDLIDMEYCRENNITVCNAAGYANVAVAELVFGMLISIYRNIIPCNEVIRDGGTKDGLVGHEIKGKKFGIIGAGSIGMQTANIAKAFGCDVYLYNRSPIKVEGMKTVDLDTLLKECDIISLHVPLNQTTEHLIDRQKLRLMKKTAVLINTARGPVVDNKALAEALEKGEIAAAGLDVFDREPPLEDSDPILSAPNTLLTPHIAFATSESMIKRAIIAFENVRQWANGTPQNVIK